MANNILDKPAMESIHEMEKVLAVMASRVDTLPELSGEVKQLGKDMISVRGELVSLSKSIEDEPLKCPFREAAGSLDDCLVDIKDNRSDIKSNSEAIHANSKAIAEVKTELRVLGGLNAAFTSLVGLVAGLLGK